MTFIGNDPGAAGEQPPARPPTRSMRGALDRSATLFMLRAELAQVREENTHLRAIVDSNRDIGAATGILMVRHGLTQQDAFDVLMRASQRSHRKLRDLASDVLLSETLPDTDDASPRRSPRVTRRPANRLSGEPFGDPTCGGGLFTGPPATACHDGSAHTLTLSFSRDDARIKLAGEIDLMAVADITRLFESLDALPATIYVDLTAVTFLDSSGLQPVIDAARRRRDRQMPPVLIDACSRPARRLLDFARVGGHPQLDIEAWNRLARPHTLRSAGHGTSGAGD